MAAFATAFPPSAVEWLTAAEATAVLSVGSAMSKVCLDAAIQSDVLRRGGNLDEGSVEIQEQSDLRFARSDIVLVRDDFGVGQCRHRSLSGH